MGGAGLAQAFSATRKFASLPVLCLNTAAGHGASATVQELSCSSLPQEALGMCQSCHVICPQNSASHTPSFQPMCHFSLCLPDCHFVSGENLQQHQLPHAKGWQCRQPMLADGWLSRGLCSKPVVAEGATLTLVPCHCCQDTTAFSRAWRVKQSQGLSPALHPGLQRHRGLLQPTQPLAVTV